MSVSQKWISQNNTKGGHFRSSGGGISEGEASPLNPTLKKMIFFKIKDEYLNLNKRCQASSLIQIKRREIEYFCILQTSSYKQSKNIATPSMC